MARRDKRRINRRQAREPTHPFVDFTKHIESAHHASFACSIAFSILRPENHEPDSDV
jgi:hypothetical protein